MIKYKSIIIGLLIYLMVTPIMANSSNDDPDETYDNETSDQVFGWNDDDSSSYFNDGTADQTFNWNKGDSTTYF